MQQNIYAGTNDNPNIDLDVLFKYYKSFLWGKNLNNLDGEFWSGVPAFFLSKFPSERLNGKPHLAM